MSGVYGEFLEAFPELNQVISVWTLDDKSDLRNIVGAFIPREGSEIKRRKYTSGNTGLDIVGENDLYVYAYYAKSIYIGDFCMFKGDPNQYRVTNIVNYSAAAGYFVCTIQKVSGATSDKTEPLQIKEGTF